MVVIIEMAQQSRYYFTIENAAEAEFKDRGSRFLSFAFPVKDPNAFKVFLNQKKKDHPKAVHHCFAYRLGVLSDQFRAVDDGEPSGSAGRPILGQIDSRGLTDTAVIVVRYFGGTLLGVPGLINAYKTAAAMALDKCPPVKKSVTEIFDLRFDYIRMNDVMRILKQHEVSILSREEGLFCRFIVAIELSRIESALLKIKELPNMEINKLVSL